MRFSEALENRTLLSSGAIANPVYPWSNAQGPVLSLSDFSPHEWTADYSSVSEGPPSWINTVTGMHFTEPMLNDNGLFQVFGTAKANEISVEQVMGLDTSADLPALVIQSPERVVRTGKGTLDLTGGGSVSNGEETIVEIQWRREFMPSQSDKIPDLNLYMRPAKEVLEQYKAHLATLVDDSDDAYRIQKYTIPFIQRDIDQYNAAVAKYENTVMTRIRVAGMYDAYLLPGDAPVKISIDSGAGDDVISIAPNVQMKTTIAGGKGSDTIISGKQKSYLSGGAGDDRLVSRSKKGGTLDGGAGSDLLEARFSTMNVSSADASDKVRIHQATYPVSTVASSASLFAFEKLKILRLSPNGIV
jgi:hypothetical protein